MGNLYEKPIKTGPNPYTRSGEPPPKVALNAPSHRIHNPMSLELHMADDRVRAMGLSTAEREWRKKFLKDQHLHPDEPIHVDAVHRQTNPFRVVYRLPWDKIYEHFLRPSFGIYYGTLFRIYVPKTLCWYVAICYIFYIYKYEQKNWQRTYGIYSVPTDSHNPLLKKGYSKEDLLGFVNPEQYNYWDRDYVHRMQTFDIGKTKRPW